MTKEWGKCFFLACQGDSQIAINANFDTTRKVETGTLLRLSAMAPALILPQTKLIRAVEQGQCGE